MTENARHHAPDRQGKGVPDPWGYYYLRYFVGAIVGAALLVALWTDDPQVLPSFPHAAPLVSRGLLHHPAAIAALGTAGLAYCYIASAPILLMHGFRLLLSQREGQWWWALRLPPVVATIILGALAWYFGTTKPSDLRSESFGLLLYLPFGLIVVLQILALGLRCSRLDSVRQFYAGLAIQRARETSERSIHEYVESYRHLREHGNALLIILMEFILAAALFEAETAIRFFIIGVIWIVPAAFTWFLGTWLEFGIVPGKADASSPETPGRGKAGAL